MENHSPSSKTFEVDVPLHSIGFEIQDLTPQKVSGHLNVTQKCCQVSLFLQTINTIHTNFVYYYIMCFGFSLIYFVIFFYILTNK